MSCKVDCCVVKSAALVAAGAAVGFTVAKLITSGSNTESSLARRKKEKTESDLIYETDATKNLYIEFHYTPGAVSYAQSLKEVKEGFDFPIRIARVFEPYVASIKAGKTGTPIRALDLGCSVGASCFELSKFFDEVVGLDLSTTFIQTANEMKVVGKLEYKAPIQGRLALDRVATMDPKAHPDNCKFVVGDALNVDKALGTFDAVLAANLIDRVPHPKALLENFAGLVNTNGILVLLSPYSWWEPAADVEEWVGGKDGKRTEDEVKKVLSENGFDFVSEHDEPFVIRDHIRRYQMGFSHCTVWRRK